ncbi:unnamed protein product, partial [Staurois parvus]
SPGPGRRFPAGSWRLLRNSERGEVSVTGIAEQYKAACFSSKTHTAHTVKQHTVNPLIAPDVNPFLPLVQCQCFLLALITVLVSLAVSQFPSQCQYTHCS